MKKEIRKQTLKQRDALSPSYRLEADQKIHQTLFTLSEWKKADAILTYVSFRSEVETKSIIQRALSEGKPLAVPKVIGPLEMNFYQINSLDDLEKGYMGILEPKSECRIEVTSGLMIMPGSAFDPSCGRIGYGGGFYDHYIQNHKQALFTCAIAYECQILPHVPVDPLDQKPDLVITEEKIYQRSKDTIEHAMQDSLDM